MRLESLGLPTSVLDHAELSITLLLRRKKSMNTYTFRAECLDDVFNFLSALALKHRITFCTLEPDDRFPDMEVLLRTGGTLQQLQTIADSVEDAHVIADSLSLAAIQ